jgi:hypothetical protein
MTTRMFAAAVAVVLAAATPLWAQLSITPTDNANVLVNGILTSGITVVGTPTYTGSSEASGTFAGATIANGLGMSQGIILTNGTALGALGPNDSSGQSTAWFLDGDSDLDTFAGAATHDASILEFSFKTSTGSVFFNYQFASEEYPEYVDQFNDVFGFFLDGNNVALVPGTSSPVSINNVNREDNSLYYIDNWVDDPDGGPGVGGSLSIQYDGLTKVFQVSVTGLSTGEDDIHTIKLAIADTGDSVLDSAVFIEGFGAEPPPPDDPPSDVVPEPASLIVWSLLATVGMTAVWWRRKRGEAA